MACKSRKNHSEEIQLGSNAKIKELTDWQQQYTFEQGIAETIVWMREHMDVYKPDIYNI